MSIAIAYFSNSIFNVLIKSCAIPVCGLFISVFFCYFVSKPFRKAAVFSVVFGISGFLMFSTLIEMPITPEISAVLLSLAGYIIGYALDRNQAKPVKNSR